MAAKRHAKRLAELRALFARDPEKNEHVLGEMGAISLRTTPPAEMRKWADDIAPSGDSFYEREIGRLLGMNQAYAEARAKSAGGGRPEKKAISRLLAQVDACQRKRKWKLARAERYVVLRKFGKTESDASRGAEQKKLTLEERAFVETLSRARRYRKNRRR
jgi:hypothetical protein